MIRLTDVPEDQVPATDWNAVLDGYIKRMDMMAAYGLTSSRPHQLTPHQLTRQAERTANPAYGYAAQGTSMHELYDELWDQIRARERTYYSVPPMPPKKDGFWKRLLGRFRSDKTD